MISFAHLRRAVGLSAIVIADEADDAMEIEKKRNEEERKDRSLSFQLWDPAETKIAATTAIIETNSPQQGRRQGENRMMLVKIDINVEMTTCGIIELTSFHWFEICLFLNIWIQLYNIMRWTFMSRHKNISLFSIVPFFFQLSMISLYFCSLVNIYRHYDFRPLRFTIYWFIRSNF